MRSGFAMRVLGAWALAAAAWWVAMPAMAQSIVVVVDPDTDFEDEDFAGVDEFTTPLFITAETLEEGFEALRDNPTIGELWLVRKDAGVWDEVFPTLGGTASDAINNLHIRGFPFEEPWRTVVQGPGDAPAIEIESVSATTILIEGITIRSGTPGVLITTPNDATTAGSVTIDRCIIRDAAGDGIEAAGVADVAVYNTSIFSNSGDGIYIGPTATASIEYVSILENSGVGLYADGEAQYTDITLPLLEPTDDAFIDEDNADTNFGGDFELRVREGGVPPGSLERNEAVLTFRAPGRDDIIAINSAQLVLHDTRDAADTPDEGVTRVYSVIPPVVLPCASCITWNNAPEKADLLDEQVYDLAGGVYAFEVGQAYQAFCNEPPCTLDQRLTLRVGHELVAASDPDGDAPLYASSDNGGAGLIPMISLVVTDVDGNVETLLLEVDTAVPGPEDPPVLCECSLDPLQAFPGDTVIREDSPNLPTGEENAPVFELTAFGGDLIVPGQQSTLLQFLIEDLEPGKIVSATLRLTAMQVPEPATVSVYGALNGEPPLTATPWTEADITWGDDNEPVAVQLLDTFEFALPVLAPTPTLFDVTDWVQGNGAISFRVETDSNEDGQFFASKESDGDFGPQLTIIWREDNDPVEESPILINNSLVWGNSDGAFFEGKPGLIQQGSEPFDTPENDEGEAEPRNTMHVDILGEIFDRDPPATASDPRVLRNAVNFPGRIIDDEDDPSPLLERGQGIPNGFNLDLDSDLRPSNQADIGADQLESISTGPITWFYSAVTPPPGCFDQQGVIGDPVGVVGAGALRVEVRVRSEGAGLNAAPDAVFILPQDHMRRLIPAQQGGRLVATFQGGVLDEILGLAPEDPTSTLVPLQVIRLDRQAVTSGATSVWIGTNSDPIDTRLLQGPGGGSAFGPGDTFADGHAVVMLAYDPTGEVGSVDDGAFNVVGDEGEISAGETTLDENGAIINQALVGRHVLIDTIPPRFDFEEFGDNPTAAQFIAQPSFPDGSNDRLLPSDLPNLADFTHPFPPPPATGPGINGVWPTATNEVPADNGALVDSSFFPPRPGVGGSLFFNHASMSNRSGTQPTDTGGIPGTYLDSGGDPLLEQYNALRAQVLVRFVDPTLEEYHNIVYDDANPPPLNPFTGSTARPVAGFREIADAVPFNASFTTTVGDLLADSIDELFPLLWGYASDSNRFDPDAAVEVFYGVTGRAVEEPLLTGQTAPPAEGSVLDFAAIRAGQFLTTPTHIDAAIAGSWHFTPDSSQLNPVLPALGPLGSLEFNEHIRNNHFVARMLFRGRDAACNFTPTDSNERTMGPLNLWWIVRTDTRMTRHTDGDDIELAEASFDWELARGFNPRPFGQPQPLYTWRVYGSDSADFDNPLAVYTPLTPWFPWQQQRTTRQAITAEEFESLADTNPGEFYGRWLLFVAVGVDEAGNVTQWPWQDWIFGSPGDPNSPVAWIGNRDRANWVRVRVNREQTARANLRGEFWWKPFNTVGLQERPPEGSTVYNSVVPLPPRPISADPDQIGVFNQAVYAKFTIELSGVTSTNFDPNTQQLTVLFDLRRRGSNQPLVRGGDPFFDPSQTIDSGYGAAFRLQANPDVRRLNVFLPIASGGDSVGFVRAEDGTPITTVEFSDNDPRFSWPIGGGGAPFVLGDQTRQSSIEYVARAAVWIADGFAPSPSTDRELQAAPSNLRFTVVPDTTRARHFRPRYSPDDQPIRVREQQ